MIHDLYKKILGNERIIVLLFCALFVLGIFSLFHVRLVSPVYNSKPALTIVTDYTGTEPETIERVVTIPIERVLKEVVGIKEVDSFSLKGQSRVVVSLDPGFDVDSEAVLIMDHVYHVSRNFPREVGRPALYRYNMNDRPAIVVSLEGNGQSNGALYRLAHTRVKEELLSVDGVARVEITGPGIEDYFIAQDYKNMSRFKGNFDTVFNSIVSGNLSLPLGEVRYGTGFEPIYFPNRYENLFETPEYLIPVGTGVVSGSDLFTVWKKKREDAPLSFVNNKPALILYIFKKNYSSILGIDREVRRLLQMWESSFSYTFLYNQAESFRTQLMELTTAAVFAFSCIFLLLLFMYRNLFFILLVIISVVFCLSGTLVCIAVCSGELNTVTITSLILGSGMCTGITVSVIDPLQRALKRENKAAGWIRRVLFSSIVMIVVLFIPIFYRNGEDVLPYADFAGTVSIMAVLCFPVQVFFIPSVIRMFSAASHTGRLMKARLPFVDNAGRNKEVWKKNRRAEGRIVGVLQGILKRPLVLSVLFLPGVVFTVLFIITEYQDVSSVRERCVFTYEFGPEYTSAYKSGAVSAIGDELLGSGVPMTLVTKLEGERATFFIDFPFRYRRNTQAIEQLKAHIAAIQRDDGFFNFVDGKDTTSTRVLFFGDDIRKLDSFVGEAAKDVSRWKGVDQILKGYRAGKKEIVLTPDARKMYYYGLDVTGIVRFLRYIFYNPVVMKHYEDEGMTDVRAKIDVEGFDRRALRSLRIPGNGGISIADFCTIDYREGPGVVTRKNGKRFISLDIRYDGVQEKALKEKLRLYFRNIAFPGDFYWMFDGPDMDGQGSKKYSAVILIMILFGVYITFGVVYKSFSIPFIGICGIFSLFIGVYVFLVATGSNRSAPVQIGLVFIIGIWAHLTVILLNELTNLLLLSSSLKIAVHSKRIERVMPHVLRKNMRVMTCMLLTTVIPAISMYIVPSTPFFRILSGVIFSGLVIGFPFAVLSVFILWRIFYFRRS